jgi:hypothetical protein
VVVQQLLRLEGQQPLAVQELLKRHQRRKKRKRVGFFCPPEYNWSLMSAVEKEESDEDMGFGLFD